MNESSIYAILTSQAYQLPTLIFWFVVAVLGFIKWNKLRKVSILLLSAFALGLLDLAIGLAGQVWMYSNIESGGSTVASVMPVIYGFTQILFLGSMVCLLCAVFVDRKPKLSAGTPNY